MDFSSLNPATSNALNLAARINDVDNVDRLLEKINPNCVDNRGWTCLHEAAYHDSYDSLSLILQNPQCRPSAETHEGHTALYLACKNNSSLKTVKALLDSAYDIANYGSTEGVTPLHIASSQGNVPLIELLIEYGAILDVQDFDGDTPLHDAVLAMQNEAVVTLVYAGADPQIENMSGGYTPFHLACCRGNFPAVKTLFPFMYNIDHLTKSFDTPLTLSVQGLCDDLVYFLLDHGADTRTVNKKDEMAIDIALKVATSPEVFKVLLYKTDRCKLNRKIIYKAFKPHNFNCEVLETLLTSDLGPEFYCFNEPYDHNMDIYNEQKSIYKTHAPLNTYLNICEYMYKKYPDKFRKFFYLLLEKGVSVNARDVSECPPLVHAHFVVSPCHFELSHCFREIFTLLIENGCNVDYNSTIGWSSDYPFPDVFYSAKAYFPFSLPLLHRYSVTCEPATLLLGEIVTGNLGLIPSSVRKELLLMVDSNMKVFDVEALPYYVLPLKHISRLKIRETIKNSKGGIITTEQFLSILDSLPLPKRMKQYIRYCD